LQAPSTTAAAPYDSLNSIGIKIGAGGVFTLDEARLGAALAADYDSVGKLFGSTDGIGVRVADVLDRALRTDGQVTARSDSLQSSKKSIDRDQAALDARMVSVEARYRRQFIAMDSLLAGLQNTSNYLAQQLGSGSASR
jgi:flagellar hook-associated protein 2